MTSSSITPATPGRHSRMQAGEGREGLGRRNRNESKRSGRPAICAAKVLRRKVKINFGRRQSQPERLTVPAGKLSTDQRTAHDNFPEGGPYSLKFRGFGSGASMCVWRRHAVSKENKEIAHRWFEEVWNKKRLSAIGEMAHAKTVGQGQVMHDGLIDLEEFQKFAQHLQSAFPDMK